MKKLLIFLPLILGSISSIFIKMDNYYIKPDFTPRDIVFPIVWSILFLLMGYAYYKSKKTKEEKIVFYTQLFINYIWSYIFFNFQLFLLAFILCIVLILLVGYLLYLFYKDNKVSGYLLIPYLLWLIFASVLSYNVYILNK